MRDDANLEQDGSLGEREKAGTESRNTKKYPTGLSDQSECESKKRGQRIAHVSAKLLLSISSIY